MVGIICIYIEQKQDLQQRKVYFIKNSNVIYFFWPPWKNTGEFPVNLIWTKGIPEYTDRTSSNNFILEIPFKFDLDSFYKKFWWKKIFPRKSFVNFFWHFKLESDFFPHFLSKIRKLENYANLFIVNFKCAKFQRNQRTFYER